MKLTDTDTATQQQCACGATLTDKIELWIGECSTCATAAAGEYPASLECPFPTRDDVMRSAAASASLGSAIRVQNRHYRDAARDAAHGYDPIHEIQQECREDAKHDWQARLTGAVCANCSADVLSDEDTCWSCGSGLGEAT